MPGPDPTPAARVLILEDDPGVARLQRLRLERAGYAVTAVTTPAEALDRLRAGGLDLLVLDNRLEGGEDGLGFYTRLKADGFDLPVVLVTGYADDATVIRALRAGVRDYVFKSVEYLNFLPEAVARVLAQEQTRRDLAASQRRVRALFESTQDAILFADDAGRLVDANPAAAALTGRPADALIGRSLPDLCQPADPAAAADLWARLLAAGRHSGEVLVRRADGITVPADCRAVAHIQPGLHLAVLRDITDRKRAEAAVRESEERLRLALEGVGGGVWDWDLSHDRAWWSREMYDLWGADVGTPMDLARSLAAVDERDRGAVRQAVEAAIARGADYHCEFRIHHPARGERWVSSRGHLLPDPAGGPGRLLGITLDITDRKRAEVELRAKTDELRATTQQLWQAAKLAGVGELAASIAHELNNPLATVHLRLEGVLAKTPPDDPRRRPLEIVDQEVGRMARLVGNLLHFIRPGRDQVSTVDVHHEVRQTVELTEPHLRRLNVTVAPELHPVPDIYADRQQLRQVLLNLFTNAGDAMPRGGRLVPRVWPGRLPDGEPAVVIEVADTGTGIPPDVLTRVFDPFFTTKEEGKGTGLGLAICKRIVEQHRGLLEIESEVGRGTTVRVTLPIRDGANVAGLRAP